MNNRRKLVAALGAGALTAAFRLFAQSQGQGKIRQIGVLFADTRAERAKLLSAFEDGLRALGHDVGSTVVLNVRYADGNPKRLDQQAKELAEGNAEIIVAAGTAPAQAARQVTGVKPILFIAVGDPVARGFVANLHSPDGNMTGSSDLSPDAPQRRFDLLLEVMPAAKTIAVISNSLITPREPLDRAAAARGIALLHVDVKRTEDFAKSYAALDAAMPDALIVTPNPTTFAERRRLAAFCRERRIATLFGWREFMDAGGLLSLGADMHKLYSLAASQLDQLLKGVPISRIPVATSSFDLVVDLRTARALGVAVPSAVLGRADKVID
jgi:putative ABC transport system substrate-binding protein